MCSLGVRAGSRPDFARLGPIGTTRRVPFRSMPDVRAVLSRSDDAVLARGMIFPFGLLRVPKDVSVSILGRRNPFGGPAVVAC